MPDVIENETADEHIRNAMQLLYGASCTPQQRETLNAACGRLSHALGALRRERVTAELQLRNAQVQAEGFRRLLDARP